MDDLSRASDLACRGRCRRGDSFGREHDVSSQIDQLAHRTALVAAAVSEVATALVRADSVVWSSLAAERFRAELAEAGQRVSRVAELLSEAAAALTGRAVAVQRQRVQALAGVLS